MTLMIDLQICKVYDVTVILDLKCDSQNRIIVDQLLHSFALLVDVSDVRYMILHDVCQIALY